MMVTWIMGAKASMIDVWVFSSSLDAQSPSLAARLVGLMTKPVGRTGDKVVLDAIAWGNLKSANGPKGEPSLEAAFSTSFATSLAGGPVGLA